MARAALARTTVPSCCKHTPHTPLLRSACRLTIVRPGFDALIVNVYSTERARAIRSISSRNERDRLTLFVSSVYSTSSGLLRQLVGVSEGMLLRDVAPKEMMNRTRLLYRLAVCLSMSRDCDNFLLRDAIRLADDKLQLIASSSSLRRLVSKVRQVSLSIHDSINRR
jgi:hypothetical protein